MDALNKSKFDNVMKEFNNLKITENNKNKIVEQLYFDNNIRFILRRTLRYCGIMRGINKFNELNKNKNIFNFYYAFDEPLKCYIHFYKYSDNKYVCSTPLGHNALLNNFVVREVNNRDLVKETNKELLNLINISIGEVYKEFILKYKEFLNSVECKFYLYKMCDIYNPLCPKYYIKKINKNTTNTTTNNTFKHHGFFIDIEMPKDITIGRKIKVYNKFYNVVIDYVKLLWGYEKSLKKHNKIFEEPCIIKNEINDECVVCYEETQFKTKCGHILCANCYKSVNKCPMCRKVFLNKINHYHRNRQSVRIEFDID